MLDDFVAGHPAKVTKKLDINTLLRRREIWDLTFRKGGCCRSLQGRQLRPVADQQPRLLLLAGASLLQLHGLARKRLAQHKLERCTAERGVTMAPVRQVGQEQLPGLLCRLPISACGFPCMMTSSQPSLNDVVQAMKRCLHVC